MAQIKVSKKFVDDFNLVVNHYECPEDEIEWLRNEVRKDFNNVSKSIFAIADEIKNSGVNKNG